MCSWPEYISFNLKLTVSAAAAPWLWFSFAYTHTGTSMLSHTCAHTCTHMRMCTHARTHTLKQKMHMCAHPHKDALSAFLKTHLSLLYLWRGGVKLNWAHNMLAKPPMQYESRRPRTQAGQAKWVCSSFHKHVGLVSAALQTAILSCIRMTCMQLREVSGV